MSIFSKRKHKSFFASFVSICMTMAMLVSCCGVGVFYAFAEETGITDATYGAIPDEFKDASAYPFAIFADGNFVGAYSCWADSSSSGGGQSSPKGVLREGAKTYLDSHKGGECTILLRRDYTILTGQYSNLSQINGTVNFDLGGHTLTASARQLFVANKKSANNTYLNVRNGTVLMGSSNPLISFGQANNGIGYTIGLCFENVKIGFASGSTTSKIVERFSTALTSEGQVKSELKFINCEFDFKTNAPTKMLNFINLSAGADYHKTDVVFEGGKMNVGYQNGINFLSLGATDSALFRSYNGEAFSLTLPKGVAAPNGNFDSDNGRKISFRLKSQTETEDTYTLAGLATPHGDVPSEYMDAEKYPFVVFADTDKDGSKDFVGAYSCWADSSTEGGGASSPSGALLCAKENAWHPGGAIIYLRRDYDIITGSYNNLCHINGSVLFDLGGHTLTGGTGDLFAATNKKANNTTITTKNGTILLDGKSLVSFGAQDAGNNSKFIITFEDVNIGFAFGATVKNICRTNTPSSIGESTLCGCDLSFVNCNFDLKTNASSGTTTLLSATGDNGHHSVNAVIKGGTIVAPNTTNLIFANINNAANVNAPDSLSFVRDDEGNYTTLTLPSGSSAPSETFNGLAFTLVSSDGDTSTYTLCDSEVAKGYTFSANGCFDMEKPITPNGSMTFEVVMTLPANDDLERHGNIMGNWQSYELETNSMNFEIQADRKARIFFCKTLKVNKSAVFDLPEENSPGTYRKLTFVLNENGDLSFYVDGIKMGETQNFYDWFDGNPVKYYNQVTPFRIGGDYRGANTWYLHDEKVKSMAMYRGLPSADSEDSSKISTDGLEAMFKYDLTDIRIPGYLEDLSQNKINAINPNVYVAPKEGYTFASNTCFDMEYPITPNGSMTFEAVMTIPANDDLERHGNIMGNWKSYELETNSMDFEIQANRKVRIFFCKTLKVNKSAVFDLPEENAPGTYRKLTFVLNENGDLSFYVDGVKMGETQNFYDWFDGDPVKYYNQVTPFRIGGDLRGGNGWYLHDEKVRSVAMYKGIPTADSKNPSKITTDGLEAMFKYDLSNIATEGYLDDKSLNDNNAINSRLYKDTRDYDYSFAIVGDTQYMTKFDAATLNGVPLGKAHLKNVYDWILSNRNTKKIKYVMGLGDITDTYNKTYASSFDASTGYAYDTKTEWDIAYNQISRLDGIVPYSVVRGNHDKPTYFDKYFADSVADDGIGNSFYMSQFNDDDFEDNSACFYLEGSALNAYTKFEAGNEKYMLFTLDDNPTDAMLEWAGAAIARNPDYRVIITTHTYLGYTGDHIDDSETYSYANKNIAEGENNGKQMWEKFVSKYENIILVLCGHDHKASNILRKERVGENGNVVNEFLICPQSKDHNSDIDPKMGMVAMLYFSNGGKDVRIEYISTIRTLLSTDGKDVYFAPDKNSYSFKFRDINEGEWDLITPANITSDGQASFKGTYYGADPITLTLIAASYVGDTLYDINFSEEKSVSSISEVELSAKVETTEGSTVKYFLWESLSTVKPYVSDTAE